MLNDQMRLTMALRNSCWTSYRVLVHVRIVRDYEDQSFFETLSHNYGKYTLVCPLFDVPTIAKLWIKWRYKKFFIKDQFFKNIFVRKDSMKKIHVTEDSFKNILVQNDCC